MANEKNSQAIREAVFPTAQLVWIDEETGEELDVEVIGAGPWIAGLFAPGGTPRPRRQGDAGRPCCRIEIVRGRG